MADLYSLLKQFNSISGIAETGQPGFCLLMALWQKSNELNWKKRFTMTNTELLYKAGFNSESTLTRTRNKLKQLGYINYIKPKNRRQCGTYILNFDLKNIVNDGSNDGSGDSSSDNSSDDRPASSSEGSDAHINKHNRTKLNKDSASTQEDSKEDSVEEFFEKIWSLYPSKKGKGKISDTKKKELYKLGEEELERCISRYIKFVEDERERGFKELKFQNGSTFFNSGYVDYLDNNYIEKEKEDKRPPLKLVIRDNY